MKIIPNNQIRATYLRIIPQNGVRNCLLFCYFWAIFGMAIGQDYKGLKVQIQQQSKLYRDNVPCEKAVKDKLEKLADLMQLTPDKPEIVRSCKFIRGMNGGCPQTALKELLLNIQKKYATSASDTTTVFVANGQDALGIPEKEVFDSVEKVEQQSDKTPPFNTYLMYVSLVVLTLLCAYLLIKLNQLQKAHIQTNKIISTPKSQPTTIMNDEILERLKKDLETLKEENVRLKGELGRVKSQLNGIQELCEEINAKMNMLERERNTDNAPVMQQTEEAQVIPAFIPETPPSPVVETPQPVIQTPVYQNVTYIDKKYALYMDNSEGFSVQGLMPYSGSETIYEILLQSERTASYRVFENADAHQYALTDPSYYLRTACEYENSPSAGKRIETVAEGVLENMGSVWKIVRKAKIRFI